MQYEVFISELEKWIRQFCEWLNIEYDLNMLQFSNDSVYYFVGGNLICFKFVEEGICFIDDQWCLCLIVDYIVCFDVVVGQLNY